jgi:hypothetical protein
MFFGENCTSPVLCNRLQRQSDTYQPSSVLSVLGNRLYLALRDTSPTLPQEVHILLCRREACPGTANKGWSSDWLHCCWRWSSSAMNISYRESSFVVDWQGWMMPYVPGPQQDSSRTCARELQTRYFLLALEMRHMCGRCFWFIKMITEVRYMPINNLFAKWMK